MSTKTYFNIGDFVQTPRGFFIIANIEFDTVDDATIYLIGKEECDDSTISLSQLKNDVVRHIHHKDGRASVNFFELAFAK